MLIYLKSYYSIFLILFIAIFGIYLLHLKQKYIFNKFMMTWYFVCSIGVLIFPATIVLGETTVWYTWRFLFLFPFYIPTAIGAYNISSLSRKGEKEHEMRPKDFIYIIISIFISSLILLLDFEFGLLFLIISLITITCKLNNPGQHSKYLILLMVLLISISYTFRSLNAIYPHVIGA